MEMYAKSQNMPEFTPGSRSGNGDVNYRAIFRDVINTKDNGAAVYPRTPYIQNPSKKSKGGVGVTTQNVGSYINSPITVPWP